MLDQCKISTVGDRVQIKPEVLTQDDCLLDGWLKCQRRGRDQYAKHAPGEETLRYHSNFEVFADRALVVNTRSRPSSGPDQRTQYVYAIDINLRKILHGQNGIPITNDSDLCAAILIARHALSHLLMKPEQASDLIPGLGANAFSYWRKLEIALDIHDSGFAVRNQMRYMKSPRITVPAVQYSDSVRLKGTNLELKAYDKIKERDKRFGKKNNITTPSTKDITRLEVVLPKGIIPTGFPSHRETIRLTKFGSQLRLTGFTSDDLRAIHRTYFNEVKGVYHAKAEKGSGSISGYAATLAALALEFNIPLHTIRARLENEGGRSKGSTRKTELQMLDFMAQSSELSADTILSDQAYESPPIIGVSKLEGCRFYVEHYGISNIYENAAAVFDVYSDKSTPGTFSPLISDTDYWLISAFTLLREMDLR